MGNEEIEDYLEKLERDIIIIKEKMYNLDGKISRLILAVVLLFVWIILLTAIVIS